jgi:hypothetical protein
MANSMRQGLAVNYWLLAKPHCMRLIKSCQKPTANCPTLKLHFLVTILPSTYKILKPMKPLILSIFMICFCSITFAQKKATDNNKTSRRLYEFPRSYYFNTDFMPAEFKICYGNWKAVSTSGGFDGNGFTLDFDHLTLKPNGIFGIVRNDSLIAYGKMVLERKNNTLNCKFIFDGKAKLELANDYEKFFQLSHPDTLVLVAPCCDRYDIKLVREK